MRQSIPRLRRVRMKNGGADVTVLRHPSDNVRRYLRRDVDECIKAQGDDLAGYAVLLFGQDGSSVVAQHVGSGIMTSMALPDYARNRLLADRIERWTIDTLAGPPPKAGA